MANIKSKVKSTHRKWIMRNIWCVLLLYAVFALTPYVFIPTLSTLPRHWNTGLQANSHTNRTLLLKTGEEAMEYRLRLITNAQQKIDVASYIFANDNSGEIISTALFNAAERGVQVRILVDGLIGAVHLSRSPMRYALGAHPNIVLKYYNPINLFSPEGLNARFHEKYFIVDEKWLLMGGRNISDEFLTPGGSPQYNFDLDVLIWKENPAIYDAISQASNYYDTLFSSSLCTEPFAQVPLNFRQEMEETRKSFRDNDSTLQDAYNLSSIDPLMDLVPMKGALFLTNPTNPGAKEPLLWKQLCALMSEAQERLWILTPYLVMNSVMRDDLTALDKPWNVRLLLNSHHTGNNIIASADDVIHRGMTKNIGIPIFEFTGDSSMHTKAILIDHTISIIGSFNFDIRSAFIDTETILVVHSEALNEQLESYMLDRFSQSTFEKSNITEESDNSVSNFNSLGKEIIIHLLSPFVSLFRFLI